MCHMSHDCRPGGDVRHFSFYNSLTRMILTFLCLRIIHHLYSLALSLSDLWKRFDQRKPEHLTAERTKIPSHLALLLVASEDIEAETTEKKFVECILRAVTWCQAVGINRLTVYDNQGAYKAAAIPSAIDICAGTSFECSQTIRTRLIAGQPTCEDDTGSEVEYPLTPPLSDTSESRPLSPDYDGQLGVVTIRVTDLLASKSCRPSRQRNVLKRRRREFVRWYDAFQNLNQV
jgi:dehydrodolichyl diphosphate syntase complex subunit NUS1